MELFMTDIINEVYTFNETAGLLDKPYNDQLEASFQIEEALEGFQNAQLASRLNLPLSANPKTIARDIAAYCEGTMSDVERLDKAIDAIFFAIGSIAKLQLTREQAQRAILTVCEANNQKLNCPKDEFGKLTKPINFIGPEVKLQEILDERVPN